MFFNKTLIPRISSTTNPNFEIVTESQQSRNNATIDYAHKNLLTIKLYSVLRCVILCYNNIDRYFDFLQRTDLCFKVKVLN